MPNMKDVYELFTNAGAQWVENKAPRLGAALAFLAARLAGG